MKVHPFIAAAGLLLAGVMAFAATSVVQHRQARRRRPPPEPEVEDPRPAPRQPRPVVEARRIRAPAPPGPPLKAELHVHVTGPHGLLVDDADVSAHRRGAVADAWDVLPADDSDGVARGTVSSSDLEPGRYDVRVEAPGMRAIRLDDVPTGPRVIEVALARAPVLLGAVGALGARGCAGVKVTWSAGDAAGDAALDEDDCTFAVETLPDAGTVTVTAARGAATARALVTPPLSGDPGVVCLAPPCEAEPASLLVYVGDTDHHQIDDVTLNWTLQGDDLHGAMGMSTGGGLLFVHGRRAGETLALRAERGDHAVESSVLLSPGVTEALLTLPAAPPESDADDDEDTADHVAVVVPIVAARRRSIRVPDEDL